MLKDKINYIFTSFNILVFLVGLVILAIISPRVGLDLSINKINSLSPASIKVVKNLPDLVTVTIYATQSLPEQVKPLTKNLAPIMEHFAKIDTNKLKVVYQDPNTNPVALDEANKAGIQPLQFSTVGSDKYQVQTGYFGMVIRYGQKQEVVPIISDIGNLEYLLVSKIQKLTSPILPMVLVADGNGEVDQSEAGLFYQYLNSDFLVKKINLNTAKELDSVARVLLIAGPKTKYKDSAVALVEGWLKSNKPLIVLQDTNTVDEYLGIKKVESGLEKLLASKGLELDSGFIEEENGAVANFDTGKGSFVVRYPYWPKIGGEGINRTVAAISSLSGVVLPWTGSIKSVDNITLIKTSNQAWKAKDTDSLNPTNQVARPTEERGEFVLAAMSKSDPKIILVADADFLKDQFVMNNQQNLAFSLNLIDLARADESLSTIRGKQIYLPNLRQISDQARVMFRYLGIGLPVLLLALFYLAIGVYRNQLAKKKENVYQVR